MAGFKFRLQSFLNVKEKVEEQKKLEYGKALNKLEEEKNVKIMLQNEKTSVIDSLKNRMSNTLNPLELQRYNHYIKLLKNKIRNQDIVIEIAEKEAEKKRTELVKVMQERKMLDILKDKDRFEYFKEQQRAEQKIVDEIVSYQFNNKG